MTHHCSLEEMALIESIQDGLKDAKRGTRRARAAAKELYKINEWAGRMPEAADINGVKAAITGALAALDNADAVGGKAAVACYDEPGPIILGGGR